MKITESIAIADEIIQLYDRYGGHEYAGERVTQLQHMAQAAQLAAQEGYEEEVVLAAFLHDIGHICVSAKGNNEMDGFGIIDHEEVGADFLRARGFSKKLIKLVQAHVEAKRYLTYKDPVYYDQLSDASRITLEYQGGPMQAEEAQAFEQHPLFNLIIQMRHWDEEAKREQVPAGDISRYRDMIVRHLSS